MSAVLAGHIYPVKVDWPLLLAELNAAGCTRYRIAAILGVSQSTVMGWEEGSDPRHAMGVAVITLHAQVCKKTPDASEKRCNASEEHA